jgi:hypothetical protein
VKVFHRAWRVYADPAASEAAGWLKVLIPLEFAAFAYRLFAPDDWPPVSGVTFVQAWYALLWVVRQRDQARAELKASRADQNMPQ